MTPIGADEVGFEFIENPDVFPTEQTGILNQIPATQSLERLGMSYKASSEIFHL